MKQIKYNNFTTIKSDGVVLDNYYYFQGVLNDATIDKILAIGAGLPTKSGAIGGAELINDESYRVSSVAWIPLVSEHYWLYDLLGKYGCLANDRMWQFAISGCAEEIQFATYHANNQGHYDWHLDLGTSSCHRKISMSVQLSDPDEYEGGDLTFMTGRSIQTASRKKGTVIAFPSYLLHRVTPVTRGTRRSLVLWLSGEPFR